MPHKIKLSTLLFLSSLLYIQAVNAVLSRGSGRGDYSSNFDQAFYYVDNSLINSVGITDEAYANFSANSIFRGVGGGGRGLGSVPSECVVGYTQDQLDDLEVQRNSALSFFENDPSTKNLSDAEYDAAIAAIENDFDQQLTALTVGEPCAWEFNQGEDLFTFGFFSLDFDTPDVNYDVTWQISNDNGGLWNLAGTVNNGSVFLDTASPADLFAGDYSISVKVGMSSAKGSFFWENDDSRDPVTLQNICEINPEWDAFFGPNGAYTLWEKAVDIWFDGGQIGPEPIQPNEPVMEICGTVGINQYDERSNPPTFFYSDPEILRILPVSSEPDSNAVNAPASLGTFLLGLGALMLRRRAATRK
ncbi:hypothetical protein [Neptunicella sp.]|uniref:hypothetical protein n=1 Tax=Neptunicella sp. TaxID=2125986 RepID=UPI003F68F59A